MNEDSGASADAMPALTAEKVDFEFDVLSENLNNVKARIHKLVSRSARTPTIIHMAQLTIDNLDTAYLWLSSMSQVIKMTAQDAVAKTVDKALASGGVTTAGGTTIAPVPPEG